MAKKASEADAYIEKMKDQDQRLDEMSKQVLLHLEASALFSKFVSSNDTQKDQLKQVKISDLLLKLPDMAECSMLNKGIMKKLNELPEDH